jgi:hypothetical protein
MKKNKGEKKKKKNFVKNKNKKKFKNKKNFFLFFKFSLTSHNTSVSVIMSLCRAQVVMNGDIKNLSPAISEEYHSKNNISLPIFLIHSINLFKRKSQWISRRCKNTTYG